METKQAAFSLLKNSQAIFIAYSHADLRAAKSLRGRFLKLRRGIDPASVFLDQDLLSPGSSVSPATIDAKIAAADLFVLVCGRTTPESIEVRRELDLALSKEPAGLVILPVILRPGLRLPQGVDYKIQGVFLWTLFPAILWTLLSAVATLVALLAVAVVSAAAALRSEEMRKHAERLRAQERVTSELNVDRLAPQVPTDSARRDRLLRLAADATSLGLAKEEAEALARASRLVTPDARIWAAESRGKPVGLAWSPAGDRLVIAFAGRVEVVEGSTGKVLHTVFLNALKVELPTNLGEQWRSWSDPKARIAMRAPARLTKVFDGSYPAKGVSFEVAYEDFGLARAAAEVDRQQSPRQYKGESFYSNLESDRSEREIFALDVVSYALSSLGLSRQIEWAIQRNLANEENGRSWYESKDTGLSDPVPSWAESAIRNAYSKQQILSLNLLAADPSTGRGLVEVKLHPPVEGVFDGMELWEDVFAVAVERERLTRVTPITSVHPEARYRYSQDAPRRGSTQLFVDRPPVLQPAALGSNGRICLRENCYYRPPLLASQLASHRFAQVALEWEKVAGYRLASSGDRLIVHFSDRSVGLYDLKARELVHKFLLPPGATSLDVSHDGRLVSVLLDGGQVECWLLASFNAQGWAVQK